MNSSLILLCHSYILTLLLTSSHLTSYLNRSLLPSFRRNPVLLPIVPIPLRDGVVCHAHLYGKVRCRFEVPDWVPIERIDQHLFFLHLPKTSLTHLDLPD